MATIISKKRANQFYYYVVESARVDGKPRIVHQTYLGTAERLAALVKDRTAPVPLAATAIELGLPGALWWAAQHSGAFDALASLWPRPRSGPSTAEEKVLGTEFEMTRIHDFVLAQGLLPPSLLRKAVFAEFVK